MADAGGGKTVRLGVGTIGVVALGVLAAIFFKGGGGTGTGGTGTGAGNHATPPAQSVVSAPPQRPLKVTIRESSYVVNGQPVDLVTLTDLATKVPPGDGPAVTVQRSPSSRAKAENDLWEVLNRKAITYSRD